MEIDTLMSRFRLASRELFNHYFHVSTHDIDESVSSEQFDILQYELFNALVTVPGALPPVMYTKLQPSILVRIRPPGQFAPLMLNREVDSGYWDHAITEFTADVSFHFIEFFDWDQTAIKDHRYVRAAVASWPIRPELVGKQALIETQYACYSRG